MQTSSRAAGRVPLIEVLVDAAVAAVREARSDTLAELVATVSNTARESGLSVLAARLPAPAEDAGLVVLDPDRTTAEHVVAAAVSSGSRLLFVQTTVFDAAETADELRALEPPGDGAAPAAPVVPAALGRQAARLDGWLRSVEVGFAHEGALVVWCVETAWSRALDQLVDGAPAPARGWEYDADERDDAAHRWLGSDEVAALAARLAAVPAFRAARTAERETAAREMAEIAAFYGDLARGRSDAQRVIREASVLLAAEADTVIDRLAGRRDELAALIAAVPQFQAIRTADARVRFAQDWLVEHAHGLRLPTWWAKELAAAAKNLPHQPTL